ncbi:hypothetical protein RI103_10880 [Paraburkholderia sp. FT54]|nr:hypothetical protein [Paraburkholderia sp. FT54]WNC88241.1 hypothetical protein RI103_10880 [Paraburkholderia sp. FT54]
MKKFSLWLVSEKIYPRFLMWAVIVMSLDAISMMVVLTTDILKK